MPPLIVTAGVILESGRALLSQRRAGAHQEHRWEFPGGKLEAEESPPACLARELKEELDIEIEVGNIFTVVYHRYPQFAILLLAYRARILKGVPRALGVQDAGWFSANELSRLPLSPADEPIRALVLEILEHRETKV